MSDQNQQPEKNRDAGSSGFSTFWAELRRRKVVRVAIAYAVVGWLVIQIAVSTFPRLGIPPWAESLVIMLTVLGFPISLILAWAFEMTPQGIKAESGGTSGEIVVKDKSQKLNYITLGLVVLVLTFLIVDRYFFSSNLARAVDKDSTLERSATDTVRFTLPFGENQAAPIGWATVLALSPDGRRLAYVLEEAGVPRLFVRRIDEIESIQIGDVDAFEPFFSADGEWIFFLPGNNKRTLRKVPSAGGPSQDVAVLNAGTRRTSWLEDGSLILGNQDGGLQRMYEDGTVDIISNPPEGRGHRDPHLLPRGQVLYTSSAGKDTGILEVLDLNTNQVTQLRKGSTGHYLDTGHLLYVQEETLWMTGFDAQNLQMTGTPLPLVEDLRDESGGPVQVAIADDGSLAYITNKTATGRRTLVWVDPEDGSETPLPLPREWVSPRISPNGESIALDARGTGSDIFIIDSRSGNSRQLTRNTRSNFSPVWSPTGARVVFSSSVAGSDRIFWQSVSGAGIPEALTQNTEGDFAPKALSPDGEWLIFSNVIEPFDLGMLNMADGEQVPFWQTATVNERNPAISPDGRWLAYESDQSGQYEVWITPFPDVDPGGGRVVSIAGGKRPVWLPVQDRLELFYWTEEEGLVTIMGGPVTGAENIESLSYSPKSVFSGPYASEAKGRRTYDVAPDGRFLMMKRYAPEGSELRGEIVWWHKPDWSKYLGQEGSRMTESKKGLSTFWAELKRRKVVRVAMVYAVVGWLVIQVAVSVFPTLDIPKWALSLLAMCVILDIGLYMDYDDNRFNDRNGLIYKRKFQFRFSYA